MVAGLRKWLIGMVALGFALGGCATEQGLGAGPAPVAEQAPVTTTQTTPTTTTTPPPSPPPCRKSAVACVRLSTHEAWLPGHGHSYGPVPIGYGVGKHATPTGTFHVVWKAEHWHSHEYGDPMPYSVFFAAGGIAFHQGSLDTSSHGCVHLTKTAAKRFFASLKPGDEVQILP